MSLDNNKVKEIAFLARLSIEDSELEQSTKELNNILSLMDQLGEIDTRGAEPMAHPLDFSQPLRNDISKNDINRDENQNDLSKTKDGYYTVPKILD